MLIYCIFLCCIWNGVSHVTLQNDRLNHSSVVFSTAIHCYVLFNNFYPHLKGTGGSAAVRRIEKVLTYASTLCNCSMITSGSDVCAWVCVWAAESWPDLPHCCPSQAKTLSHLFGASLSHITLTYHTVWRSESTWFQSKSCKSQQVFVKH